jgi:aconitate hydratase
MASPPLVVAYALSGRIDIDLASEPLGTDADGRPVYLRDLWPSAEEVKEAMERSLGAELFREEYGDVFAGSGPWKAIRVPEGGRFDWKKDSTYIRKAPFFDGPSSAVGDRSQAGPVPIRGARALVMAGDSVTTDHISPAGSIAAGSPAAKYLEANGVEWKDLNSYGARRGNHEVMLRGTFANVRFRNALAGGEEGGVTTHVPSGERMSIPEAAERYRKEGVPLIIIAGKDYGMGSSRDWAAKGPKLLGVRAALFESVERIHRSNLIGMGILPLQFEKGENAASLGLTGRESFDLLLPERLEPRCLVEIRARDGGGKETRFLALCRIDTPAEAEYCAAGGILPYMLEKLRVPDARIKEDLRPVL